MKFFCFTSKQTKKQDQQSQVAKSNKRIKKEVSFCLAEINNEKRSSTKENSETEIQFEEKKFSFEELGFKKQIQFDSYLRCMKQQSIPISKLSAQRFQRDISYTKQKLFRKVLDNIDIALQMEDYVLDNSQFQSANDFQLFYTKTLTQMITTKKQIGNLIDFYVDLHDIRKLEDLEISQELELGKAQLQYKEKKQLFDQYFDQNSQQAKRKQIYQIKIIKSNE